VSRAAALYGSSRGACGVGIHFIFSSFRKIIFSFQKREIKMNRPTPQRPELEPWRPAYPSTVCYSGQCSHVTFSMSGWRHLTTSSYPGRCHADTVSMTPRTRAASSGPVTHGVHLLSAPTGCSCLYRRWAGKPVLVYRRFAEGVGLLSHPVTQGAAVC